MTQPRKNIVSLDATAYYHITGRCVRRAFLCGYDKHSRKHYDHRKAWVIERMTALARVFAIDICAYAVMSNHYHLVLRLNPAQAADWSDDEVIRRWQQFFHLPLIVSRYQQQLRQSRAEQRVARKTIALWRERLADLSWFMRCLNEHLARMANAEDQCTGRFWEGRYGSQALLDEAAVLTCMSYVDLNPIRAGIATLPEDSDFTSIQQRLREFQPKTSLKQTMAKIPLMKLTQRSDDHPQAITFTTQDYLQLVDWAGRAMRNDKRGFIPNDVPPILERLGISPKNYLKHVSHKQKKTRVLGKLSHIQNVAEQLEQNFLKGTSQARQLFPEPVT